MNVQSIICNISFPKTIDQLRYFIYENGRYNVEDILCFDEVEWTVPKWIGINDIVFFFHAKTAIQHIRRLKKDCNVNLYDDNYVLLKSLEHASKLYNSYGGKIFAIGKVVDRPFFDNHNLNNYHWSGKLYARIGEIHVLNKPIDISAFSDFLKISRQSSITEVVGGSFEQLKKTICETNIIPSYLQDSSAIPVQLRKINRNNWLKLTLEYRRKFFLEIQFRRFYVDYFLCYLSDRKPLEEIPCFKKNILSGYADNAIFINNKWCFVEVKLNIDSERDITTQLKKYSCVEMAMLKDMRFFSNDIIQNKVIIIDTQRLGIFNCYSNEIDYISSLDDIINENCIIELKGKIIQSLF